MSRARLPRLGWGLAVVTTALLGATLLVACLSPSPPSGAYQCDSHGACPDGYRCGVDQLCYKKAELPDLSVPPIDFGGAGLCGTYCDCMINRAACPLTTYPDAQACLDACAAVSAKIQQCWIDHCEFAIKDVSNQEAHCLHATGRDDSDPTRRMCKD